VLADLPGLIERASEGAGIGTRFLGHVERCAVILHLVDGTQDDVAAAYRTIRRELALYGHGLAEKPEIVGLNKIDALDAAAIAERRRQLQEAAGSFAKVLPLAGATGAGVPEVLGALFTAIRDRKAASEAETGSLAETS
jgi:GTPase